MNFYEFYNLLNEYGESLIQTLIIKFQQEEKSLSPDIIKNYIDRFERIKNNLPERDITKYSWKDLENTVDGYQTKERTKAGKIDETIPDANLLLNRDGIRVYLGKDKKSCIKYSNGYTFCIGARGENNMYGSYRIGRKGTPYFIFNDNLPKEDPKHLIVLFVGLDRYQNRYSVTLADNQREKNYDSYSDLISAFPWLDNLNSFLNNETKGRVDAPAFEYLEYYLKRCFSDSKFLFQLAPGNLDKIIPNSVSDSLFVSLKALIRDADQRKIEDFLNNKTKIAFVRTYPILLDGHIPVKDVESVTDPSKVISIDFPRYFNFFTKNSQETLKHIKEKIKYFIEDHRLYNVITNVLNEKEAVFQKMLDENKEVKENLRNGYQNGERAGKLTSVKDLFNPSNDVIVLPYLVFQINDAKHAANELIEKNIEQIKAFYNEKTTYSKCYNYVKTLTEEKQRKILAFCQSDSVRDILFEERYGFFPIKIVKYFMKNEELFNKNMSPLQIDILAQKIYYSTDDEISRL